MAGGPAVEDIIRKALVEQIQGNFIAAARCFLLAFKIQPAVAADLRDEFLAALRSLSTNSNVQDVAEMGRKQIRSKSSSRTSGKVINGSHSIPEGSECRELEDALPYWRLAASIFHQDVEVRRKL